MVTIVHKQNLGKKSEQVSYFEILVINPFALELPVRIHVPSTALHRQY